MIPTSRVTHIFVADEMGRPTIKSNITEPFVSGGYVIPIVELAGLEQKWRNIKLTLCGSSDIELKWSDFFVEPNETVLKETNDNVRRMTAMFILFMLFRETSLLPLLYIGRKEGYLTSGISEDDEIWIKQSRKGNPKFNREFLFISHIARFSLYLKVNNGIGEIWHDDLGSIDEKERHNVILQEQLSFAANKQKSFPDEATRQAMLGIVPHIKFLDSKTCEAVQVADFLCGALFRGGRGDMDVLSVFSEKYGREAEKNGVGIFRIQKEI